VILKVCDLRGIIIFACHQGERRGRALWVVKGNLLSRIGWGNWRNYRALLRISHKAAQVGRKVWEHIPEVISNLRGCFASFVPENVIKKAHKVCETKPLRLRSRTIEGPPLMEESRCEPRPDFLDKLVWLVGRLLFRLLPNIGVRSWVLAVRLPGSWELASVQLIRKTAGRRGRDNLGNVADR